jgi:hypothetical protein
MADVEEAIAEWGWVVRKARAEVTAACWHQEGRHPHHET